MLYRVVPPASIPLDPAHPFTRAAVFLATPNSRDRADKVSGAIGSLLSAHGTFDSITPLGPSVEGVLQPGAGVLFKRASKFNLARITTRMSIVIWAMVGTRGSYDTLFSVPYHAAWLNPFAGVFWQARPSVTYARLNMAIGATRYYVESDPGYFVADGRVHQFAVTRNGTSVVFYKDGLPFGAPKVLGSAGALDWGSVRDEIIIGNNAEENPTGDGWQGPIVYAGLFAEAFTAAQIRANYADPFQHWQAPAPITPVTIADESASITLTALSGSATQGDLTLADDTAALEFAAIPGTVAGGGVTVADLLASFRLALSGALELPQGQTLHLETDDRALVLEADNRAVVLNPVERSWIV